jgi:hypothetical protein
MELDPGLGMRVDTFYFKFLLYIEVAISNAFKTSWQQYM